MYDVLINLATQLLMLLVPVVSDTPTVPAATSTTAGVVRVIDGDTVDVFINDEIERVRYIGIDTPEYGKHDAPDDCFAEEAANANRDLVSGAVVTLRSDVADRDDYDRLLRYVYVGDTFVNAELVRGGFATALPIKPNTTYADYFWQLQQQAQARSYGQWESCVAN